jgi:hypothetical protein
MLLLPTFLRRLGSSALLRYRIVTLRANADEYEQRPAHEKFLHIKENNFT